MQTALGTELTTQDRNHVLSAYVHRMTHESIRRFPSVAERMRAGGFRLPIISDDEWLGCTNFGVRKDGRLDMRQKYCESQRPVAK